MNQAFKEQNEFKLIEYVHTAKRQLLCSKCMHMFSHQLMGGNSSHVSFL